MVSDALLGKPFATRGSDPEAELPHRCGHVEKPTRTASLPYLTITINNTTGVLYLVKRGDGYVATKTVG